MLPTIQQSVIKMANVRDSDTSLWLHNKLGTSNDSWTGGSICSQLNAEVLRNIKDCFSALQTQVKLKLLLSFFHIPRRNVEEWRIELEEIIDVASLDTELWVSMLAEAMKTFPATGSLNTEISDLDEVRPIFTDLVSDLRKLVKKQSEAGMLPMECHYLNKPALHTLVGQQPAPIRHFITRKKPKSALLRADLLQKSNDAASNLKKSSAPVIPVRSRGMPRKMTDTTPLKGIPSRVLTSGFRSSILNASNLGSRPPVSRTAAGRKEGGVKLLDIADQPLGYTAQKKRKRLQELEEAKKTSEAAALQSPPAAGTTPDYAAGLSVTPTYAPPTPQPVQTQKTLVTTPTNPATPLAAIPATPVYTHVAQTPALISTNQPQVTIVTNPVVQQTAAVVAGNPQFATATVTVRQPPPLHPTQVAVTATVPGTAGTTTQLPVVRPSGIVVRPMMQRKGLALTREQMIEAQDMFKTANKVTRPEKALILGFMAGSRDNPCPHLGNIVTIKLSEDHENVCQGDDTYLTMLVETHFQMNYNNGEWKRIKKCRAIENVEPQPIQPSNPLLPH